MPREKEEVEKVAIVELKITKPASKTKFIKSEKFTTDGLEVTLVYSDGSEAVTNNYEISPKVGDILAQSGFKNVIIKYDDKDEATGYRTVSYRIHVSDISRVRVVNSPTKTNYIEGEELDLSGILMEAYGTISMVKMTVPISHIETSIPKGTKLKTTDTSVEVWSTYNSSAKTYFDIRVSSKSLVGIEVSNYITEYTAGDKLNVKDIVVKEVYDNGEKIDVEKGLYKVEPKDGTVLSESNNKVTVSIKGGVFTKEFAITVKPKPEPPKPPKPVEPPAPPVVVPIEPEPETPPAPKPPEETSSPSTGEVIPPSGNENNNGAIHLDSGPEPPQPKPKPPSTSEKNTGISPKSSGERAHVETFDGKIRTIKYLPPRTDKSKWTDFRKNYKNYFNELGLVTDFEFFKIVTEDISKKYIIRISNRINERSLKKAVLRLLRYDVPVLTDAKKNKFIGIIDSYKIAVKVKKFITYKGLRCSVDFCNVEK
jgi:putative uncharacterized protein sb03g026730